MQAETEELAKRVESLTAENIALKSEINQLVENSQKLRLENATLTVTLIICYLSYTSIHNFKLYMLMNNDDKVITFAD